VPRFSLLGVQEKGREAPVLPLSYARFLSACRSMRDQAARAGDRWLRSGREACEASDVECTTL